MADGDSVAKKTTGTQGSRDYLSLSRCCMLSQMSRPGAPAMTALLRDLLPLSSS